jgi:hypothetical protein
MGIKASSSLSTHNQLHTVNHATSIQYNSSMAKYIIFVDNSRLNLSSIPSIINAMMLKFSQSKIYMQQETNFLWSTEPD